VTVHSIRVNPAQVVVALGIMTNMRLRLQVLAYVNRVKDVTSDVDHATFTQAEVESNDVRCPDSEAAKKMYKGELTSHHRDHFGHYKVLVSAHLKVLKAFPQ